jgi:glycosyltransferase involved in cell wall biosynthesis
MNVLPSKVTVVRNWSHLEETEVVDRVSSRKELGWADDDIIVLHAGNMGVKQGLENVVEAARLASEQGSRVRFVLLGDGNQRTMLEQAATGVEALRMLPSLSDDAFRRALAAADVLLVNERPGVAGMAVPSKLTSYFSTGLPVIAATDPGSVTESEILLSGGGTSVPAGDPQALLSAAEMLGGDSLRSVEMGRSGRRFRDERLSSRASFDTYAQLLQGLAQGRRTDTSTGSGND